MLRTVFGFRGHVTGLQYFIGVSAVILAAFAGASVFFDAAEDHTRQTAALAIEALDALAAIGAGLLLWVHLSLTVRRFRDIGLNPVALTGAWIAITVLDGLAAQVLPALAAGQVRLMTPVGELVALATTLFLIFWPSRRDERYVSRSGAIYRD